MLLLLLQFLRLLLLQFLSLCLRQGPEPSPADRKSCRKPLPGALRLTHGTGDDNVHYQNTLLLMDALQKAGYQFEVMFYPDGMHGYRGYQGEHDKAAEAAFWTKWLLR